VYGSISACTEPPSWPDYSSHRDEVYLLVYGATIILIVQRFLNTGLSPRVRSHHTCK